MKQRAYSCRQAFTLLELMMVLLLVGAVSALVLPSAMSLMTSSQLNQGTTAVVGQIKYARQLAMSGNTTVEVRFYQYEDPNMPGSASGMRAMQLWTYNPDGTRTPVGRMYRFPGRIVVSADSRVTQLGNALDVSSLNPTEIVKGLPSSYQFRAFQFFPDGSTSLAAGANHFTLITESDPIRHSAQGLPANFATVQIETLTGAVNLYRP